MNDTAWQTGGALYDGAPVWLTLSFVLIGLGILLALFVLAWGTRIAKRRQQARHELEQRGELSGSETAAPPAPAPPIAPAPAPIAETPVIAATPEPAPEPEAAPFADEPIAAAAPLDASPATVAASEPAPAPAPVGADQLTRMKGVGPKVAERLNTLGITSFAQLAALSPAEADALDAQLGSFQGRLRRDRWVEQAGFLARGDQAGYEAVFGKL